MDEEEKKQVVCTEKMLPDEDTGFVAIIVPPEYIHWMGFVVSFLLLVITSVFLKYDELVSQQSGLSPVAYIDMLMMFMALFSCIRCLYRYIRAWVARHNDDDEDDEDDHSEFLTGDTTVIGGGRS